MNRKREHRKRINRENKKKFEWKAVNVIRENDRISRLFIALSVAGMFGVCNCVFDQGINKFVSMKILLFYVRHMCRACVRNSPS